MTRLEILNELKIVFSPYTPDKAMLHGISESTDIIKDLKINSANLVDIIIDAETKYNIEQRLCGTHGECGHLHRRHQ